LTQLVQRVRLRFHLAALSKSDMTSYIDHRLEVAGSQGRRIFQEDTYSIIYRYTGGVPRLINTLCDTAMMAAYGNERDIVTTEDVQAAIEELQWSEFSTRANRIISPAADALAAETHTPVVSDQVVARILVAHEGKTLYERELRPGRLIIGRTTDNDVPIDSKFISRHHCQIVTKLESCVIEDLNSTNGIYVKSKRVRKHNFNDGDVVVVGQHEIMYIDERSPRQRSNLEPTDTQTLDED
jgi:general secretion pathway protein A